VHCVNTVVASVDRVVEMYIYE